MGLLKKLAVIGGAGLAISELSKSGQTNSRSANINVKNVVDTKAVKELIAKDPNLLALVRGEQGIQGIQGVQGVQGVQGIQGEQGIQGLRGFNGSIMPTSLYRTTVLLVASSNITITHNLNLTGNSEYILQVRNSTTKSIFNDYSIINETANSLVLVLPAGVTTGTHDVVIVANGTIVGETFSRSLLINGAAELNSTANWQTGCTIGGVVDGMNTIVFTGNGGFLNNTLFFINTKRLTKVSLIAKCSSAFRFLIEKYAIDNTYIGGGYPIVPLTYTNTSFANIETFLGGDSNVSVNYIGTAVPKIRLKFNLNSTGTLEFYRLTVKEISLGEPVPYNLPWLPTFQTVYDPTTYKLGLYNGTSIVWSV